MKVAVIIPAYNAEATIELCIDQIHRILPESDIFIIDDGSNDNTASNASKIERGVSVITHKDNCGVGAAIKTGLKEALDAELYTAFITIGADMQRHDEDIAALVKTFTMNPLDLVVGSKMIRPQSIPTGRYLFNTIASCLYSFLFRVAVTDLLSGFRVLSKRAAERALTVPDNRYTFDLALRTYCMDLKALEIPVGVRYHDTSTRMVSPAIEGLRILFRIISCYYQNCCQGSVELGRAKNFKEEPKDD